MAFTSPKTYSVGDILTAADMNTFQRDNVSFLAQPPMVRVHKSTDFTSAGETVFDWENEDFDTDSMFSSSEASKITINTAGKYHVTANSRAIDVGDGNSIQGRLRLNSTTTTGDIIAFDYTPSAAAGSDPAANANTLFSFSTGDFVVATFIAGSGGNFGSGQGITYYHAHWVGN